MSPLWVGVADRFAGHLVTDLTGARGSSVPTPSSASGSAEYLDL
jgi:hypothetical protein